MSEPLPRAVQWAATMAGHSTSGDGTPGPLVRAHRDSDAPVQMRGRHGREEREAREAELLSPGATLARGAGNRAREEEPDPERTCFERDRDRIVHSTAFRRLAGKTQVVVHPADHERTRLTHALEVAQVATSIARGIGVNVALVDAIALGHDCGHGPGGHASEDAFDHYIPEGYDHGPWGADVVLTSLNLCAETLDGIRNHSWSRPAPGTVEGEIVSWADRIAYCAHDLEDAVHAGIVAESDIPAEVAAVCGRTRRDQLRTFVHAVIDGVHQTGQVGMAPEPAQALAGLRAFNYERIYTRPESVAQAKAVVRLLRALTEHYAVRPREVPGGNAADPGSPEAVRAAVTWIGGMTDRYAFDTAVRVLAWPVDELPQGIDRNP
ncbi:deoxyguanosinetriphosphate triphosphohydrolase [Enemella dayhoffiae]|uniref:Deoxyguanosinetriphosphate triphosphohydrolase n=1 Tax=Enemella dayhoffiae TaxID=2016507 RepID=A0A255GN51_9ACTN|nr:HD domain-containing protein [Enemella dayhoffiae]OYO17245.1 deoxyguanosinetriphosphate triphosphohydrolase [Enemella dayhoffiae]